MTQNLFTESSVELYIVIGLNHKDRFNPVDEEYSTKSHVFSGQTSKGAKVRVNEYGVTLYTPDSGWRSFDHKDISFIDISSE